MKAFPIFNDDTLFYTSAFFLPEDIKRIRSHSGNQILFQNLH